MSKLLPFGDLSVHHTPHALHLEKGGRCSFSLCMLGFTRWARQYRPLESASQMYRKMYYSVAEAEAPSIIQLAAPHLGRSTWSL